MTQLHVIDQLAVQESLVTELLVELPAIDEKAKLEGRFYEVMEWISQNETRSQSESVKLSDSIKMRKEHGYDTRIHYVAIRNPPGGDSSAVSLPRYLAYKPHASCHVSHGYACGHHPFIRASCFIQEVQSDSKERHALPSASLRVRQSPAPTWRPGHCLYGR
jgi:hypothetical protein